VSDIEVALSKVESKRLDELEKIIEKGKTTFLEVGNALLAIREEKLYRPQTFEQYCLERWNFTDRRARQLMTYAETGTRVPVSLPTERHARVINGLPEHAQEKMATLIADKSTREAEAIVREYREREGVGRTFNRHPRLIALAEELGGLEGRWTEEMCKDLTPPQARKQLLRIEKAIAILEKARVAVEYKAATMHTWAGH
jgi:hypothetical protein